MAKRGKSSLLIVSNLGRRALVLDEDDVIRMLRAAVEREGGQSAFARLHGVPHSNVNKILNGRARVQNLSQRLSASAGCTSRNKSAKDYVEIGSAPLPAALVCRGNVSV
jgi:predicted transcriptional regulator